MEVKISDVCGLPNLSEEVGDFGPKTVDWFTSKYSAATIEEVNVVVVVVYFG